MSDPARQENEGMTTTTVDAAVDSGQKLEELLEEAALDGTKPTEMIHVASRSGKGLLTIDPNQTEWTPAQRTALKSIGIETEGPEAVPIPNVLQFLHICQMRDLDPFLREAYLIVHGKIERNQKGNWVDKRKYTLVIGIDGFRKRAEDTGEYAGQVGPEWCGEDMVWKQAWNPKWGNPVAARVGILRKGHDVPTYGVAMFEEFVAMVPEYEGPYNNRRKTGRMVPNDMWQKMPANQIAKCAEAQGFRKAMPRQMSGMYEPAEMDRAQEEYKQQQAEQLRDESAQRRMTAFAADQARNATVPGVVVDAVIVDDSQNTAQQPVSVAETVRETVAGMQAPEQPRQPQATDDERRAWLLEEVEFLEKTIGHSMDLLAKRHIESNGKPIKDFSADQLQLVVNPLRAAAIAKLRDAGHEDAANSYRRVPVAVSMPLHVMLGERTAEPVPVADGRQPHRYVNEGGICGVEGCGEEEAHKVHIPA